jgi:hypothetical protein
MGSKLVCLNKQGELQTGPKYVEENYAHMYVSYEVDKSRGWREMRYGGRTFARNLYSIKDKKGYFEVLWHVEHQATPNDWHVKKIEVLAGQFAKLKDAEVYAVKLAFQMKDIYNCYSYSEVFDREDFRIEDFTLLKQSIDRNREPVVMYEQTDLHIKNIDLDMSNIQKKKEEIIARNKQREIRLQGGEDTRIMVKVLLNVNLSELEESIANYLQDEVDSVDGVGADGDSVYNVDEVQVKVESTGQIEATFYLERESGKFASADELGDSILTQLGEHGSVEVPIEVNQ